MRKLWHDDVRPPPAPKNEWYWARTNREAIRFLIDAADMETSIPEASLDHDLGEEIQDDLDIDDRVDYLSLKGPSPDGDGVDLCMAMYHLRIVIPKVTIHSWNPSGAARMASILRELGSYVVILPYRHEEYLGADTYQIMLNSWPK